MVNVSSLFLTLLAGLFFLIGFMVVKFVKNKKKLAIMATSMAFVVMIGIIFLDLLPEIIELMRHSTKGPLFNLTLGVLPVLFGMGLLKVMDVLIPHHYHNHHDKEKNIEEHQEHANHIGMVTVFSLVLHNILEGVSIAIMSIESFSVGFMMSLAVGLHNLPLGIEIASSIDTKKNKKLSWILLGVLIFSSVLGALLLTLMGNLHFFVLVVLMGLSLGMILYIALFELLKEIFNYKKHKEILYGFLIGIIFILGIIFID